MVEQPTYNRPVAGSIPALNRSKDVSAIEAESGLIPECLHNQGVHCPARAVEVGWIRTVE